MNCSTTLWDDRKALKLLEPRRGYARENVSLTPSPWQPYTPATEMNALRLREMEEMRRYVAFYAAALSLLRTHDDSRGREVRPLY